MEKRIKYPIEAFALAMILFSSGMKEAMLVGITIIFGDILQCLMHEKATKEKANGKAILATVITVIAFALVFVLAGRKVDAITMIGFVLIAILEFKHMKENFEIEEFDFDQVLFSDSLVYAAFVVLAIIREYFSTGKVFQIGLPITSIVKPGMGNAMFALILAGVVLGIFNKVFKNESVKDSDLWVCIPIIILEVPFVFSKALESDGKFLGIVFSAILYFTYRKMLDKLNLPKWMQGIPSILVLLGIIYMVLSIF